MGVQDSRPLAADEPEQIGQDSRVEPAVSEANRVDAVAPQVRRGLVLRPDADQARLETGGVESGEPPGEQARDPVRARAADAELVAQVEHPDLLRQGPLGDGDRCGWRYAPGWIRTTDPQLRRLLLYPTELRAHLRTSRTHYSNPAPATASPSGKPPPAPRRMVGFRTHFKEIRCFDSVRCCSGLCSA